MVSWPSIQMDSSVSTALRNGAVSTRTPAREREKARSLKTQLGVYSNRGSLSKTKLAAKKRRSSVRKRGTATSSKRQSLERMTVPDNIFDEEDTHPDAESTSIEAAEEVVRLYSKSHSRHYYYNKTAQRLGWSDEEVRNQKVCQPAVSNKALLHDVEVKFDSTHNRLYYYSRTRGKSVWTLQVRQQLTELFTTYTICSFCVYRKRSACVRRSMSNLPPSGGPP